MEIKINNLIRFLILTIYYYLINSLTTFDYVMKTKLVTIYFVVYLLILLCLFLSKSKIFLLIEIFYKFFLTVICLIEIFYYNSLMNKDLGDSGIGFIIILLIMPILISLIVFCCLDIKKLIKQ